MAQPRRVPARARGDPRVPAAQWARELDYRLEKELWAFTADRIAVASSTSRDAEGQWWRSYGNEMWEFDAQGLMRRRYASINDARIEPKPRAAG